MIMAMRTCRGRDSPRLRRSRACASGSIFSSARDFSGEERHHHRHRHCQLVKAVLNFVRITSRRDATREEALHPRRCVSVTNTPRSRSNPRSIRPQTPRSRISKAGLPESTDGKTPARQVTHRRSRTRLLFFFFLMSRCRTPRYRNAPRHRYAPR